MKKYLDKEGVWLPEVAKKLGIPDEQATISKLEKLIDKGHFLKKRRIYPSLSNQKIMFIELPKDVYERVMYLMDSRTMSGPYIRTGYFWLFGYPIMAR